VSQKESQGEGSSYFPEGVFNLPDGSDNHPTEGLVKYLRIIGEPSLLKLAENPEAHVYRLIWMGALTGRTMVLRLTIESNGAAKLFVKETSNDGTTILNKEDNISIAAVNEFLGCVERGEFWQLSSREQREPLVKDGTAWFLEGARHGNYHVVYRRNPYESRFTDIGRYLAKDLAKLRDTPVGIPPKQR